MFPLEKRKNKTIIINIITVYSFNYPNNNEVSMPLYLLFEKEGNYLKQDIYVTFKLPPIDASMWLRKNGAP